MLILLRHGQSISNAVGLLVGRSDPPLTDLGVRQAELAGDFLAGERPPGTAGPLAIFCSPLDRARSTAEIVAARAGGSHHIRVDDRLIELDYGKLDGFRVSQVDPTDWAAWRADPSWRPPGGETLVELHARVTEWTDEVASLAGEGDVIAVSHVSPIKAAAAWAIGAGPELSWRLSLGVAAITRISTSPRSLHSFGETGHLARAR